MKVKELKQALKNSDDNLDVVIWLLTNRGVRIKFLKVPITQRRFEYDNRFGFLVDKDMPVSI